MPEAPELACNRDYLNEVVNGKVLRNLSPQPGGRWKVNPPPGWTHFIHEMEAMGCPTVEEIQTKGKFMWWKFSFPGSSMRHYLHNSFGMSGGWYPHTSKHTGFKVEWKDGEVNFTDPRHFGTLKFICNEDIHLRKLATLGPCILGSDITKELFENRMILQKRPQKICESLMNQHIISGVGNYIKSESLLRAGISPWRSTSDITKEECTKLFQSITNVARESYMSHGASIKTYTKPDGLKGAAQFSFRIYSKKLCHLGHNVINETTPDGRTSWWCDTCQK